MQAFASDTASEMASRVLRSRVLLSAPWSPMRPVRAAGLSDMSRWRFGMNPSCTPTESRMGCDSAGASSRVGTAIRGMLRFSSRWGMALIASDGNGEASHRQSMTSSAPRPRTRSRCLAGGRLGRRSRPRGRLPRGDRGAVDQPLPRREGGGRRDRRASAIDGRRIPGDVGGPGQVILRLRPVPREASGQSFFAASSGTVTFSASRGCRITARRRVFALALGFLVTRWTHPDGS